MARLQLQMMRAMAQHAAVATQAAMSARDLQTGFHALAQSAPQAGVEGMMAYFQQLAQIVSALQAEMAQTLHNTQQQAVKLMREQVQTLFAAGKNAPAVSRKRGN